MSVESNMLELFFCVIFGFFLGFLVGNYERGNGWEESHDMYERFKKEKFKHEEDLRYYKKLCKTLADENAEFRRNSNKNAN